MELHDGTIEESTRWITKHGITLRETGFIDGKQGKLHFLSEFSNLKIFKHCVCHKIQCLMTIPSCKTGTDRIAEVSKIIKAKILVNIG